MGGISKARRKKRLREREERKKRSKPFKANPRLSKCPKCGTSLTYRHPWRSRTGELCYYSKCPRCGKGVNPYHWMPDQYEGSYPRHEFPRQHSSKAMRRYRQNRGIY